MAVTVYRSTDASAPTLSGTVGDLVNVLDKCLVSGYTGKTAAGWTKPFTGTNAAVFRQGAGNQMYLDVNDNGPGTATAQEARLRGYETMTAVATGTAPFPTVAQSTPGIVVRKSAAASAAVRVWTLIADDRTFYLLLQAGDTAGCWYCFSFGDFYSYVSGTDNFRTIIMGRTTEASATITNETADKLGAGVVGHYLPRSYSGLGGSGNAGKFGDGKGNSLSVMTANMVVPNPADGAIWLGPLFVADVAGSSIVRGKLRGFFHWLHTTSFADQDTVAGSGAFAGRTFLLFRTTGNSAAYCIDITGPWDTN